jgi:hypothetical protein
MESDANDFSDAFVATGGASNHSTINNELQILGGGSEALIHSCFIH